MIWLFRLVSEVSEELCRSEEAQKRKDGKGIEENEENQDVLSEREEDSAKQQPCELDAGMTKSTLNLSPSADIEELRTKAASGQNVCGKNDSLHDQLYFYLISSNTPSNIHPDDGLHHLFGVVDVVRL